MQNTSNYSMNLVEGTDIVNIPVQLNPNFNTIDSEMFKNKQAGIGTATEVVTGTSHAIIRSNPDSDVFRFTATGAWTAGDTMSVDGNSVTVHLADGTTPPTGAYIIGAEVVAVINSSLVTLLVGAPLAGGVSSFNSRTGAVMPTAGDYVAGDIDYDNTSSGLVATEVQSAIDEVVENTKHGLVSFWENSDPSINYSDNTVTIDITGYTLDSIILSHEIYKGETFGTRWTEVDMNYVNDGVTTNCREVSIVGGNVSFVQRTATFAKLGNSISIAFGHGMVDSTTNDAYMIPIRIMGLIHNS